MIISTFIFSIIVFFFFIFLNLCVLYISKGRLERETELLIRERFEQNNVKYCLFEYAQRIKHLFDSYVKIVILAARNLDRFV